MHCTWVEECQSFIYWYWWGTKVHLNLTQRRLVARPTSARGPHHSATNGPTSWWHSPPLPATTHHTRDIHPMLFQCCPTVFDAGPTLKQHWVKAPCLLGPYLNKPMHRENEKRLVEEIIARLLFICTSWSLSMRSFWWEHVCVAILLCKGKQYRYIRAPLTPACVVGESINSIYQILSAPVLHQNDSVKQDTFRLRSCTYLNRHTNTMNGILSQFSLYVHKGGLKPDSFHFTSHWNISSV